MSITVTTTTMTKNDYKNTSLTKKQTNLHNKCITTAI